MQQHSATPATAPTGPKGPRVVVFGGRNYPKADRVYAALRRVRPSFVIVGCAGGADAHTRTFVQMNRINHAIYYAQWGAFGVTGKGDPAGPIRNKEMRDDGRPDFGIAFPGDEGTRGMIKLLLEADIPVYNGENGQPITALRETADA